MSLLMQGYHFEFTLTQNHLCHGSLEIAKRHAAVYSADNCFSLVATAGLNFGEEKGPVSFNG